MKKNILTEKLFIILPLLLFIFFITSYIKIHSVEFELTNNLRQIWTQGYQFIALIGGVLGLILSMKWGGIKSILGKSILFFSIGLLSQFFGGTVFTYYTGIKGVELPYPSLADIGYLGSTLSYILAAYYIAKVVGMRSILKSIGGKLQTIAIPGLLITISYFLFLRGYEFDWSLPLTIFLDFAYPLGDAIYISFGIIALVTSSLYLGGIMKKPLTLLLIALFVQFISDYNFLYEAYNGTWVVGGRGDFIYMTSYCLMFGSILYIKKTLDIINKKS